MVLKTYFNQLKLPNLNVWSNIPPQLLEEYVKEKKKNELLVEQEQELRNQLSLYTEKFEEFQKTLTRYVWYFRWYLDQ